MEGIWWTIINYKPFATLPRAHAKNKYLILNLLLSGLGAEAFVAWAFGGGLEGASKLTFAGLWHSIMWREGYTAQVTAEVAFVGITWGATLLTLPFFLIPGDDFKAPDDFVKGQSGQWRYQRNQPLTFANGSNTNTATLATSGNTNTSSLDPTAILNEFNNVHTNIAAILSRFDAIDSSRAKSKNVAQRLTAFMMNVGETERNILSVLKGIANNKNVSFSVTETPWGAIEAGKSTTDFSTLKAQYDSLQLQLALQGQPKAQQSAPSGPPANPGRNIPPPPASGGMPMGAVRSYDENSFQGILAGVSECNYNLVKLVGTARPSGDQLEQLEKRWEAEALQWKALGKSFEILQQNRTRDRSQNLICIVAIESALRSIWHTFEKNEDNVDDVVDSYQPTSSDHELQTNFDQSTEPSKELQLLLLDTQRFIVGRIRPHRFNPQESVYATALFWRIYAVECAAPGLQAGWFNERKYELLARLSAMLNWITYSGKLHQFSPDQIIDEAANRVLANLMARDFEWMSGLRQHLVIRYDPAQRNNDITDDIDVLALEAARFILDGYCSRRCMSKQRAVPIVKYYHTDSRAVTGYQILASQNLNEGEYWQSITQFNWIPRSPQPFANGAGNPQDRRAPSPGYNLDFRDFTFTICAQITDIPLANRVPVQNADKSKRKRLRAVWNDLDAIKTRLDTETGWEHDYVSPRRCYLMLRANMLQSNCLL